MYKRSNCDADDDINPDLADDVAGAFVSLLDSDFHGAVNIASGEAKELREMIGMIGKLIGREELVRLDAKPASPSEPMRIVPDVSILRGQLGFQPRLLLSEGLSQTINWWRSQSQALKF